jgi:uncharacterized protein involved in exopolysaccharide biosynthesis
MEDKTSDLYKKKNEFAETVNELNQAHLFTEALRKLWVEKSVILKILLIFIVFGFIWILTSPKEYKSEVTVLIENESKTGGVSGLLQQFGGLAGININNAMGNDALRPDLYPDVIKSTPFLIELMDQKVVEPKYDSLISVKRYFSFYVKRPFIDILVNNTFGLPGKIFSGFSKKKTGTKLQGPKSRIINLSKEDKKIAIELLKRINIKEGETKSTLTISIETQDPYVSAQIADSVVNILSRYITDYRTQKSKNDLNFITNLHREAELKYINAQEKLAFFRDKNKNIVLSSFKSEEEKMQSEFNLAFNIFNGLSQQLEQAKIKVQERTPVFKVIDPPVIPTEKNNPKTSLILLSMIFFGLFAGIIFVKYKTQIISIKNIFIK